MALDVQGKTPDNNRYQDSNISFPNMYNPNPIGGRLYLQAIGLRDDQVTEEFAVDLTYQLAAENGRSNTLNDGQYTNVSNESVYTLTLSKGFILNGMRIEAGTIIRAHQDHKETPLSVFLAKFHKTIGQDYLIPGDDQFDGAIGENKTVVIGKDGQFFITNAELYAKMQLLQENHEFKPNLAIKFTLKMPTTGLSFDNWAGAITLGASKQLGKKVIFQTAVAVSYQGMTPEDLNSHNGRLQVNSLIYDIYTGIVWDFGDKNGFYVSLGNRLTKAKMQYKTSNNPEDSNLLYDSNIIQFKVGYVGKDGKWEWYLSAQEDIYNPFKQLEPDFSLSTGVLTKW